MEVGRRTPADLPGYVRVGKVVEASTPCRGAGRGQGMFAFVRTALACRCKNVLQTEHALWVQVQGLTQDSPHVTIGAVYIPPTTSRKWVDEHSKEHAFTAIRDQILRFQQQGLVAVFGDFNARVGCRPDVVPGAQAIADAMGVACDMALDSTHIPVHRATSDTHRPCAFGKLLVQHLCIETGCVLLNGRAPGDEHGACTSHSGRDGTLASCIDYGIIDMRSYSAVRAFRVLPRHASSDHSPLHCELTLPEPSPSVATLSPGMSDGTYAATPRWVPHKREAYVAALLDPRVQAQLKAIEEELAAGTLPAPEAACQLSTLVLAAATRAFGARAGNRLPSGRVPKAWFRHCTAEWRRLQAAVRAGDTHAAAACRREFNTVRRRWKRHYSRAAMARMRDDLRHNPRKFWTAWRGPRRAALAFDLATVQRHWRQLYCGEQRGDLRELAADATQLVAELMRQRAEATPGDGEAMPPAQPMGGMEADISMAEVLAALQRMAGGRAAGPDGVQAEFLKGAYYETTLFGPRGREVCRTHVLLPALRAIMHAVFASGAYPAEWSAATLTAVFKKGDAQSLDNYRGIAVGSAFGKLFSMVLDARLSRVAEQRGWRAEGQAGFRRGRRTADHVFVLRHLIDRTRRRGGRLFCCFVDFAKAYDSVRRDLLMKKLAALGLGGRMLHAVANMYFHVPLVTRVNGSSGLPFHSTCGVKQGDPLSPLLFGLFIDEFEQWLHDRLPNTGVEMGGEMLRMLLYADDLVLLSTDPAALQQQLDLLHEFCGVKALVVNEDKTEVVVFGNRMYRGPGAWQYAGSALKVSESFRYLGVILHATRGLAPAVDALKAAATRGMWAMIGGCKERGISSIDLKLHLFQSLISPIMHYCSEVWGPDLLLGVTTHDAMLDNALQPLQSVFLRHMGGLRKCVARGVLLREFGCFPVSRAWLQACVGMWNRLVRVPPHHLLHRALVDNVRMVDVTQRRSRCWTECFLGMLRSLGLTELVDQIMGVVSAPVACITSLPVIPIAEVFGAWDEVWDRQWLGLSNDPRCACSDRVRHATYHAWFAVRAPMPNCLACPAYVRMSECISQPHLRSLIQFRTGSHCLRIETGRWDGTMRSDRTCRHCHWGVVEDEMHLVFECPAYMGVRRSYSCLFSSFGSWGRSAHSTNKDLAAFMMQSQDKVASFIFACFQRRYMLEQWYDQEGPHGLDPSSVFEMMRELAPAFAQRLLDHGIPYSPTAGASRGVPRMGTNM